MVNSSIYKIIKQALISYRVYSYDIIIIQENNYCKVFKIKSDNKFYALKMYPSEFDIFDLNTEIEFVFFLNKKIKFIPTYHLSNDNCLFYKSTCGVKITLYDWIDGNLLLKFNEEQIKQVTESIYLLHKISFDFKVKKSDFWLWSNSVKCLNKINVRQEIRLWLSQMVHLGKPWEIEAEHFLCHNDYHPKNIIWSTIDKKPNFLDFTNTILCPLEWDIASYTAEIYFSNIYNWDSQKTFNYIINIYSNCSDKVSVHKAYDFYRIALAQKSIFKLFACTEDEKPYMDHLIDKIYESFN